MAFNFDEKYKKNIDSLAKAQQVDTGTAAAMLRSNLAGTTQYKGGGVLDYGQANKDLAASRASEPTKIANNSSTENDLYRLQERRTLQALDAARKSGLSSLRAEAEQVNPYYDRAISTVGGQSATNARNLAEYLAQRGQTNSGVSAQAAINSNAALMSNVGNLESERANRFSDISRRESEVQNAYDQGTLEAALNRQMSESQAQQAAQAAAAEYEQELMMMGYKQDLAKELANYKSQLELNEYLSKQQIGNKYKSSGTGRASSGGGASSGGASSANLTKDQAFYQDMQLVDKGTLSPEQIEALSMDLIGQYGLSKYKQLLEAAKKTYVPFSGVADFRILAGEQ